MPSEQLEAVIIEEEEEEQVVVDNDAHPGDGEDEDGDIEDGDGDGDGNGTMVDTTQILQRPDETPLQNENTPTENGVDRTGWYRPDPSSADQERKRFNIKCATDSLRVSDTRRMWVSGIYLAVIT